MRILIYKVLICILVQFTCCLSFKQINRFNQTLNDSLYKWGETNTETEKETRYRRNEKLYFSKSVENRTQDIGKRIIGKNWGNSYLRSKRNILNKLKAIFKKKPIVKRTDDDDDMDEEYTTTTTPRLPTKKLKFVKAPLWAKPGFMDVPYGAFVGAFNYQDQPLYIGRAKLQKNTKEEAKQYFDVYTGTILPNNCCVSIALKSRFISCFANFEVLIGDDRLYKWVYSHTMDFFEQWDPVPGGHVYPERKIGYICRQTDIIEEASYENAIGFVDPDTGLCWVSMRNDGLKYHNFEVLVYV